MSRLADKPVLNFEDCERVIRWWINNQPAQVQKKIQDTFDLIREDPNLVLFSTLKTLMDCQSTPRKLKLRDWTLGMVAGVALAAASTQPDDPGSIHAFLEHIGSVRGKNVADIADALRKRRET